MTDIQSRRFATDDLPGCLRLFDGNTPDFFAPLERTEYRDFLSGIGTNGAAYLVLTRGTAIVACGGLIAEAVTGQASLAWGMVDRALHGRAIGARLLDERLALARAMPGIRAVRLATSQHSRGFYERFGFAVTNLEPDGFGKGLDRCDMVLRLA